jgi:hypothetical protein
VACGGVRVLEQTKTRKTKRIGHTRKTNGGCRSPHQKMSEVTPSYRDLPHRGSMNPGRASRWCSGHCPRGVPAMKMTPLQASNLKQEDNLRPQKMYHTANDTAKRFGFFLPTITWLIRLSVVGPDESRAPRPDPFDEGKDDTWPGNTPTRLQKGRISKERGVDSEEQHTGCLGFYLHRSPNKECPVAPSGTDHASAAGTCQKRHPIGLMEADGPSVDRYTQK